MAATNDPEHVLKRTHFENAEFVLGELRALGFPPPPDSRLVKMRNALARGYVPFEDSDFPTALQSLRDLQQLGFVFDQANASRARPKFRDLTKKLLSDSVLPQSDLDNSVGRDAQFELFLAAVCQKAGLFPVDYDEPDVLCTVNSTRHAIAAKRLKSLDTFEKHVRKAANQIAKESHPGIIALDMTLAFDSTNHPIMSPLEGQFAVFMNHEKVHGFLASYESRIRGWVEGKGVLALVIFNSWLQARHATNDWSLEGLNLWFETHPDDTSRNQYSEFYRAFCSGMPNQVDLSE